MVIAIRERPQVLTWRETLRKVFTTTNASDIGLLYIMLSLINFALAGNYAYIFRTHLAVENLLSPTTYYDLVSLHGIVMIFFFVMPILTGFANYLIPRMIGAEDLYWPKINALSFWLLVPATVLVNVAPLFGPVNTGWYMYTPLATDKAVNWGFGVDLVYIALILSGTSSTLTGINFLLTILRLRRVPLMRMSLMSWAFLSTAILMILAMPPLTAGLVMAFLDRNWGTAFFNASLGGDPVLWQHLFWFFGHPEVYILVLPAMGLVSEVLPRMAQRPIYGYTAVALSSVAIAFLSTMVWVHHMFTVVPSVEIRTFFSIMTMLVAVPSGVKVYNWTMTLYGARIRMRTPMLYMLGFIATFIIGGVTGVFFPVIPVDLSLNDTYFVVGHFHLVIAAIVLAAAGALFYYFPYITGRWYHEGLGKLSFILVLSGFWITFNAFNAAGVLFEPRRYAAAPLFIQQVFQGIATVGAYVTAAGLVIALLSLIWGYVNGPRAKDDPWGVGRIGMPDFVIPTPVGSGLRRRTGHEEHGTWFPSIFGIVVSLIPIGALLLLNGLVVVGVLLILTASGLGFYWLYDEFLRIKGHGLATNGGVHLGATELISNTRWTIGLVIGAESFLFGGFLGGAWYTAIQDLGKGLSWPLGSISVEYFPLPTIMTIILLASSIPAHLAHMVYSRGNVRLFRILALLTMGMGIAFLLGQVYEFTHVIKFTAQTNVFGSFFYATVNLHAFHVIMGLILWFVVLARSLRGFETHAGALAATYYWHFVDVVWIFVFSTYYLNLPSIVFSSLS